MNFRRIYLYTWRICFGGSEALLQQQSEQAVGIIDRAGDSLAARGHDERDQYDGAGAPPAHPSAPQPPPPRRLIILPAASPLRLTYQSAVRIQLFLQHHSEPSGCI